VRDWTLHGIETRWKKITKEEMKKDMDMDDVETRKSMATRLLQLRIRELQMELADVESQLAVAHNSDDENLAQLEKNQLDVSQQITDAKGDLTDLSKEPENLASLVSNILERVAQ
jgi:hypothetical protein